MEEAKRRPDPSELTDAQWEFIKPLLPPDANTGRPRNDDRELINGILYLITTGCGWHEIRTSWLICHRPLLEYQRRGVWQKIVALLFRLAYQKDQPQQCLPRCERGEVKKRGKDQVGSSRKQPLKGLKRHLVIDANANPLNFTLSQANWHDQRKTLETIDGIKIGKRVRCPKRLGLDKGYDSEPLKLRKGGIVPKAK